MRHPLHLLHVLALCNALNKVDGIIYLLICLAVVLQDQKRRLAPLRLDDIPGLLDGVQLTTLRRQKHLLEVDIEDIPHLLCLVHAQVVHHN